MKPTDSYRYDEPNSNMWFRQDTVPENHINPVEVTHIDNNVLPRSGHEFKTTFNFDDNSENYKINVDGVMKVDLKSPIWQHKDEDIQKAMLSKLQEQYDFLSMDNMRFVINRVDGIIEYYYKDNKIASNKIIAELQYIQFKDLDVGEPFYIVPERLQEQAPGVLEDWQKSLKQVINPNDMYIKRAGGFCVLKTRDTLGDCVDASIKYKNLKEGASFNLDINNLMAKYPEVYGQLKDKVKGLSYETEFIKIDQQTFYPTKTPENKLTIKAGELPITFGVWVVVIDKSAEPPGGIKLSEVPAMSIFTLGENAIAKQYRESYHPYSTEFLKISPEYFMLWRGGKTVIPGIMEQDPYNFDYDKISKDKLRDQYTKMSKQSPMFYISTGNEAFTDLNRRQVSGDETVFIKDTITPKKKNTLEAVLNSMFSKYETKKDELGEYIEVTTMDIAKELEAAKLNYQQFEEKTNPEWVNIDLPKTDTKTDKKDAPKVNKKTIDHVGKKVRTGATDKFSWTIGENKKVVINRVK